MSPLEAFLADLERLLWTVLILGSLAIALVISLLYFLFVLAFR